MRSILGFLHAYRKTLVFLALMLVFRSSFADWNSVPTGSMQPTIVEGDRILVDKLAFDLNLPLTHVSLHRFGDPQRGDVVVFDSKAMDTRLVKRVIGLPGDEVMLVDDRLIINGAPAAYTEVQRTPRGLIATETLPGGMAHRIQLLDRNRRYANFGPVTVPPGHYLMLGDNRDDSTDSRVFGPVPREEIAGRTRRVVMSLNYDKYYLPRGDRFLHVLD